MISSSQPGLSPCFLVSVALTVFLAGCATAEDVGTVQFVESFPAETPMDLPGLEEASTVWPRVIDQAGKTFRVASFYYSRIGDGEEAGAPAGTPDLLAPVLERLALAAGRGVIVQMLADSKFMKTYPEAPTWMNTVEGAESRVFDVGAQWGGVLHAKYFSLRRRPVVCRQPKLGLARAGPDPRTGCVGETSRYGRRSGSNLRPGLVPGRSPRSGTPRPPRLETTRRPPCPIFPVIRWSLPRETPSVLWWPQARLPACLKASPGISL